MVGKVAGRVLDHADADRTELASTPQSRTCLAFVLCRFDVRPIDRYEGDSINVHE